MHDICRVYIWVCARMSVCIGVAVCSCVWLCIQAWTRGVVCVYNCVWMCAHGEQVWRYNNMGTCTFESRVHPCTWACLQGAEGDRCLSHTPGLRAGHMCS